MDHTCVKERRKVESSDAQMWKGWGRRRKNEEWLFGGGITCEKKVRESEGKKKETFDLMKTCQFVMEQLILWLKASC